jgi:hypothetical protein
LAPFSRRSFLPASTKEFAGSAGLSRQRHEVWSYPTKKMMEGAKQDMMMVPTEKRFANKAKL